MRRSIRSPRSRRVGGLTLATVLAAATVTLTAPPASAAGYTGQAQASTSFSVTTEGGATGTCSNPGGSNANQIVPFSSNGVPATANLTSNAVTVDSGEPADSTSLSASVNGSASATEQAGSLKTFDMKSTTAASVNAAQGTGSDCDANASAAFTTNGQITLTATSIMVLDTKVRGGVFTVTLVETSPSPAPQVVVDTNINSNGTERRVYAVPAGTYIMVVTAAAAASSPQAAGDPTSDSSAVTAHAEFYAPGSALAPRAGLGKKYMKLPDIRNCLGDSVTADFTRKAGKKATAANGRIPKIRNAKFYVDGDRVTTKRKPHKNTTVTLTGLDDTDEVAVRAVLKLWDKSKVEVTRSYLPCT